MIQAPKIYKSMRSYFLIIVFFLPFLSIGQDLSLSSSISLRPMDEYRGLLHHDNSGYTIHLYERGGKGILGEPGRRLILEKYNKSFQQVYSYEYDSEDNPQITVDIHSNGARHLWYVIEKVGSYDYQYKAVPIELDGTQGKPINLYEVEITKAAHIPFEQALLSRDSTVSAFMTYVDNNKKRDEVDVYAAVFQKDGSLLWDGFYSPRGNQKQYELLDQVVLDDGSIVLLGKYYRDAKADDKVKDRGGKEKAGYKLKLTKLTADAQVASETTIDLRGGFIHDAKLLVTEADEIICAGFSSGKHRGNLKGVFYSAYDFGLEEKSLVTQDFGSRELINMDKADVDVRMDASDKRGIDRDFQVQDFLELEDGSILLTAENVDLRRSNNVDPFNTFGLNYRRANNTILSLHTNDVVGVRFSPQGKLQDGIFLIPKKQSMSVYSNFYNEFRMVERLQQQEHYLSYGLMDHEEGLYFIYNDHRDNTEDRDKRPKRADRLDRMRGYLHFTSGDNDEKIYLFKDKFKNMLLSPAMSRQVSDDLYFFSLIEYYNRGNRRLRIGVMDF